MENVEEQILSYPHCSQEKKREIEALVESNPDWAPLLRDVRGIEGLVRDIGAAEDAAVSEAFLATYVTMMHVHPNDIPPVLSESFARLEARIDEDAVLRDRVEAMHRRLKAAEAEVSPATQFEELTGHSLSSGDSEGQVEEPASNTSFEERSSSARSSPSLLDVLLRLPTSLRWTGAAVMLLLCTYGGLYAISVASQSPLDRLAAVDVSDQVVESYSSANTRSATPSSNTSQPQDLYLDALSTLREARTTTLGLFPQYDSEKVDRAEQLLTQVLEREEAGAFLALEARFYLGKVFLAQERVNEARTQFEIVVERDGRQAGEARRILQALREETQETR